MRDPFWLAFWPNKCMISWKPVSNVGKHKPNDRMRRLGPTFYSKAVTEMNVVYLLQLLRVGSLMGLVFLSDALCDFPVSLQ